MMVLVCLVNFPAAFTKLGFGVFLKIPRLVGTVSTLYSCTRRVINTPPQTSCIIKMPHVHPVYSCVDFNMAHTMTTLRAVL